ncbi:MAG: aminotransferase class I/II-fold pyridoxal phosphate-dependent enzyme [bacterium]
MAKKQDINSKKSSHFTQTVHSGEMRVKYADALTVPIVQTSTYVFHSTEEIKRYTSKRLIRYEYARYGNPTQEATEDKLAILEGADNCLVFDSGMSAITTTLLALLSKGDHIILTDDLYGQTLKFSTRHLPRFGIDYTITKMGDYKEMEKAVKKNTRIIFTESPTNPYLNIIDLDRMREIKEKYGTLMIIDSTFATPYNQKPLEWGVDLVIQSATKYLAGHNDILAGAVLGGRDLMTTIRDYQHATGSIIDPHCCYLLLRGLKTAALRVDFQNKSAMKVAEYLEQHPKIKKVFYPGLPSHPHHHIARAQMKGYGGVLSFWVKGNLKKVNKFLDALKSIYIAPSLGGVETLITHPATVSYYRYTRKERYELGINDQLCRLALGIEDPDDVIADLDQALHAMEN